MQIGPLTSKKVLEILQLIVTDLALIKSDLQVIKSEIKGKKNATDK